MSGFLWLLLCFASLSQSAHFIGTGRGAIRAVQSGNKYYLQEVSPHWDYIEDGIEWNLEMDNRFPNGVFIRSVKFPNLVWDTQGYQFTSGTPIVLFTKKNTLVDTKNQRWVLSSSNRYGVIYNENMVANVTQAGRVVLAPKSNSPYQKFFPVDGDDEMRWITFDNFMGEVRVTVQSRLGVYDVEVPSTNPSALPFYLGSVLTFHISPAFTYTVTGSEWLTLPPPPTLPTTPTLWLGELSLGIEYVISMTLTFDGNKHISGTGIDTKWGAFNVYGSQTTGLHLSVHYTSGQEWTFQGVLVQEDNEFRLSGEVQRYDSESNIQWGQMYLTKQ